MFPLNQQHGYVFVLRVPCLECFERENKGTTVVALDISFWSPWLKGSPQHQKGSSTGGFGDLPGSETRESKGTTFGYGSKLNYQGTAGFSPSFYVPGFHFGYMFLTHRHLFAESRCLCRCDVGSAWDFPLAKSEKRELLLQHIAHGEQRLEGNEMGWTSPRSSSALLPFPPLLKSTREKKGTSRKASSQHGFGGCFSHQTHPNTG